MEDVVKLVTRKLSGSSGHVVTDSKDLQGRPLKFREDRKKLLISVEISVNWLSNQSPPWSAYYVFMSGRLIALNKNPGVRLVGIKEMLRQLFANCGLKFMGPKSTNACQDYQLCTGLKAGIYDTVHGVQTIWDANLSTETWYSYLCMKNTFNKVNNIWNALDSSPFMAVRSSFCF